jgi:hypothetical protein
LGCGSRSLFYFNESFILIIENRKIGFLTKRENTSYGIRNCLVIQNTLGSKQGFQTKHGSETSFTGNSNKQQQDQTSNEQKGGSSLQIKRGLVSVPIVQEIELDNEKDWQNGLQHFRDDTGIVEILKSGQTLPFFPNYLGGGIKSTDDNVRRKTGQSLDGSGSDQTSLLVLLEVISDFRASLARAQFLVENVGVLNGLASTLTQILQKQFMEARWKMIDTLIGEI